MADFKPGRRLRLETRVALQRVDPRKEMARHRPAKQHKTPKRRVRDMRAGESAWVTGGALKRTPDGSVYLALSARLFTPGEARHPRLEWLASRAGVPAFPPYAHVRKTGGGFEVRVSKRHAWLDDVAANAQDDGVKIAKLTVRTVKGEREADFMRVGWSTHGRPIE